MRVEYKRTYTPHATYSEAQVIDGLSGSIFDYKVLELPWKDNKRSISCIPEGEYTVTKMQPTEKRPYVYFWVRNVPGRDGILWHPGNYTRQIKGCHLPGKAFKDLDKDGIPDVTETTATLKKLAEILPDKFQLIIKKA